MLKLIVIHHLKGKRIEGILYVSNLSNHLTLSQLIPKSHCIAQMSLSLFINHNNNQQHSDFIKLKPFTVSKSYQLTNIWSLP